MMGLCSFPKIHWQPPEVAPFTAGEEEREVELEEKGNLERKESIEQ